MKLFLILLFFPLVSMALDCSDLSNIIGVNPSYPNRNDGAIESVVINYSSQAALVKSTAKDYALTAHYPNRAFAQSVIDRLQAVGVTFTQQQIDQILNNAIDQSE